MKLLLIGIQGSGKSTQGNLLSNAFGVRYLSTGHIFRDIAHEKSQFGRYIKEVMNTGALIPDDITLKIVADYLKRAEYKKGYILDGFPRTITQAEQFVNGIDKVFYLKVSDKEALKRLSFRKQNGTLRDDDTVAAIRKRIELFHEVTKPVIEYYRKKGILVEVNGEQLVEKIQEDILKSLKINETG